jgi:hypothetical protein
VDSVLEVRFVAPLPESLIRDKAYDADPLDGSLKQQGIEMIAPHRSNRKKIKSRGRPVAQALQKKMESSALLRLAIQLQKVYRQV